MTFVHPNGAARSGSARIRILGCDPPPPRRRGPNWHLLGACAVAAVAGVGIAVAGQGLFPQILDDASPDVAPPRTMEVMGQVSLGARMPNEQVLRVMSAISADFPAAARHARRTAAAQPVRTAPASSATTTASPTSTPVTVTAPNPPATSKAVIGPEQPLNPASPNSLTDSP